MAMMKWVCKVCGYVHEGNTPPEKCPVCGAPADQFVKQEESGDSYDMVCEHVVGVAADAAKEIKDGIRMNYEGECMEVGMYLAMSRQADREGFPEIAEAYRRYAFEEADHAARCAEMLGEVVTNSTQKNLQMRKDAEQGACMGKTELAKLAKEQGLDAVHDSIHEMAKDEARHGKGFDGLLKRYFNA